MGNDQDLIDYMKSHAAGESTPTDPIELSFLMTDYVAGAVASVDEAGQPQSANNGRIHVVFCVPKNRYKGSNVVTNRIVDQNKSQWLRNYAEKVWTHALKTQCGITAKEPADANWRLEQEDDPKLAEMKTALRVQEDYVSSKESSLEDLKAKTAVYKEWKNEYRKTKDPSLKALIDDYDSRMAALKNDLKTERKLLTRARNEVKKIQHKADVHHSSAERKSYIKSKMALNENNRLFKSKIRMMVRTNVITDHIFDAPNSWPSIKPIQDGGTDTCILWADDNNDYIKSTTFYGGWKASRDYYVMEIIVESIPEDFEDPFDDKIVLPDVALKNIEAAEKRARKMAHEKKKSHE